MEFEFVPVDYDYFDFEDKNYVKIVGRSLKGKKVCVVDSYEPNFWVILDDKAKKKEVDELKAKIEGVESEKGSRMSSVIKVVEAKKNFLGKEVNALQVYVTNHKDMHAIASEIGDSEIIKSRRGYDVPIITKYIMQGGLEPLATYSLRGNNMGVEDLGGVSEGLEVDLCVRLESAKKLEKREFEPRVLSYDIESELGEIGKGEILMIGLYGKGYKKILTCKNESKKHDYVEKYGSEKEMIEAFIREVREFDPDVMCGYFSDGYDLPFLKERARKYKMKLSLGVDGSDVRFSRGVFPTGKINGIVHVDLYRFIANVFSQYLASETLTLNEVAGELVGLSKEDFDFARMANMKQEDWEDFYSYNLRDVEVTYKLFFKVWPDLYEFSKIVKEPIFDISRDTMATNVENYVLHNLDRFNEIPEKRPLNDEIAFRRSLGKYEGAFVYEPTPGLYENVVMFDFTSMYGSVIVSYNLSRSTFEGGSEKEGFNFSKKKGFFPTLLEEVIEMRKKYKKEYAKKKDNMSRARSNAYKLLANAAYGYQGFFGARYYSREAAASTARLAKENILSAIDKIRKAGYEILYSDTDSIAFVRGDRSKKEVLSFLKELNSKLPGIMELDLEDFYTRGLFVSKRSGTTGAKKKYALIDEKGVLKIRGFETVRRDWCRLARDLQNDVLREVLRGNEKKAEDIVRDVVKRVKKREITTEKLIIKTQLKKTIGEYVATGPHVAAAKKMEEQGIPVSLGMLIEFYIGEGKGKRIGDRVKLPDEGGNYDVEYYLNNQILPAVENIFEVLDVDVKEILSGQTQKELFDF